MKRICILLLSAFCLSSCWMLDFYFGGPPEHYFDPVFNENSERQEMISCLGEVCYFEADYELVMTKFEFNCTDFSKPFKYVIEIEGLEPTAPKVIKNDSDLITLYGGLRDQFPSFYDDLQPTANVYTIAFYVPINLSQTERKVEVKLSVSNAYDSIFDWGEWQTVFSAVQEPFTLPEQTNTGKVAVDYDCFAVGQDSTAVYEQLADDPFITGRTYCEFVEESTGVYALQFYDSEGVLVDKGIIRSIDSPCEDCPASFNPMIPQKEIVSRLDWEIDFTNSGSRNFHVFIVSSENKYGVFGDHYEIYLYEDLISQYAGAYDIDLAVRRYHMYFKTPTEMEEDEILDMDYIYLDGYTLLFGEYAVAGIPGYDEVTPEHLLESVLENIEKERYLHDYSRIVFNKDRTYSITEYGEVVSSGTYEMEMPQLDIDDDMCYYYPGPCSRICYLTLTDTNGDVQFFHMQISAHTDESKEYGIPWVYQYIEYIDGNFFYPAGIRCGLIYQE